MPRCMSRKAKCGRRGILLTLEEFRRKLLDQREALFRDVVQMEEELLWLEMDVEGESVERGQEETIKAELEENHRALRKTATGS